MPTMKLRGKKAAPISPMEGMGGSPKEQEKIKPKMAMEVMAGEIPHKVKTMKRVAMKRKSINNGLAT